MKIELPKTISESRITIILYHNYNLMGYQNLAINFLDRKVLNAKKYLETLLTFTKY